LNCRTFVDTDWIPPSEFDDYVLMQPLGRGGIGQVFLALDTVLARHVAVKFISHLDPSPHLRERFLIEARAAARVQHPNVAAIHRVGTLELQPYIVSEFVRGKSLDKLELPLSWEEALRIGIDLSRGLAAAHRKGVLHCDIKPANAIVADDGAVKLFDFGLARLVETHAEAESAAPTDIVREASAHPGMRAATWATGTPDYMAPEIWRGEPPTRRSDLYSLGALLYALCAAKPPHAQVPEAELSDTVQRRDITPLATAVPTVEPRFAAVIDRCLRRDPAERPASADELRDALEQIARAASGASVPGGNPYRGLRPFDAEHRALFFGRSLEIGVIVERLRAERFVLVAGDSGVGKSSLCRAGVLPLFAEEGLGEGRTWSQVSLVPGRDPVGALTAALASALGAEEGELSRALRADPAELSRTLRKHLGDTAGLLVFIDQLEEIATLGREEDAALVEELLVRLCTGPPGLRLLATVRADFLTRLASLPVLGDEIPQALQLLRPLSPERIREAIVGPAHAAGIRFESESLVETLVNATAQARGGLPLLQFALAELWEARDRERGVITAAALTSMGGVAGALARHADAVLASLLPAQRGAARRQLVRLVTLHATRARRAEAELTGGETAARAALDGLIRGRLVVICEDEAGSSYELAHEALIEGWPALRAWLQEDAGGRLVRERLAQAAVEWERLGRAREALWSDRRLAEGESLEGGELSPREADFLRLSRWALRRRRLVRRTAPIGLVVLLGSVYGAMELKARVEVNTVVELHLAAARPALAEGRSEAEASEKLRREAFARFDAGDLARGEELWAEALQREAQAETSWVRASEALEAAVARDGARPEVRGLLADTLYRRALVAEGQHQTRARDELLSRLSVYDDGERMRRWKANARLTIESVPLGASVAVSRYVAGEAGALREGRRRDLGKTPVAELELEPGSYLLILSAPSRATIRYPVLLGRAEVGKVAVELPAVRDVPPGFVFVPAGRFLFGSAADEEVRRGFFETVPLHEARTGSYLIARHEVTIAQWLEYLAALDPRERAVRTPSTPRKLAGSTGGLKLEWSGRSWTLSLQLAHRLYRARQSEPLRYDLRTRRAAPSWDRFPVTAISAHDAEAYAAWLDGIGRVPGARLCSEQEWERAARGADDRSFPHGYRLAPDDANYDETYGKNPVAMGPDEVGSHPRSESPFGLHDAVGNAWEWTTSSLKPGQYVGRGGAYYYSAKTGQLVNRQIAVPTLRDATLGLRVCASWPGRSTKKDR
jgi:formylglycine-generating enzyme required for sulfatase activity